jgi:hypothetical protein
VNCLFTFCPFHVLSRAYEAVSKSFRTESITKCTLTFSITRWEAIQRVMATKLIRLTHKAAIQLQVVAESCTNRSSRSRRPVRKLLDTPSYPRAKFVYRTRPVTCKASEQRSLYFNQYIYVQNIAACILTNIGIYVQTMAVCILTNIYVQTMAVCILTNIFMSSLSLFVF